MGSEDAAAIELGPSCSNRTVFLNLSGCSSPAASAPLFANVDVSHSVLFVLGFLKCHRQMRPPVEPPDAHHLCFQVPQAHPLQARFLSFTRSVSAVRSLYALILAFPVKVLSMIYLIPLSTFVVVWFDRSSIRCQRCTTRSTSCVTVSLDVSRQHIESSWLNLRNSFHHNSWQWRSSSFLCQL